MFQAFVIAVRTSYLMVVLHTLAMIGWLSLVTMRSLTQSQHYASDSPFEMLAILALLLAWVLTLRALARLMLRHDLVPESHLRERPVIATLVGLASIFGTWMILLVDWALLTPEPGRSTNLAAPAALGIMCYAFALLTGELILVGGRQTRPT